MAASKGTRLVALTLALCMAGCATTDGRSGLEVIKETFASDDPCSSNARNIGTALGAAVGILVATQLDSGMGKVVAVAATGLIGNLIGADMDRRRCELHRIAQAHALSMDFQPLNVSATTDENQAFSMSLRDNRGEGAQFAYNSDRLTPRAREYFAQIARQYAQQDAPPMRMTAEEKKAWQRRIAQRRLLLIGHTDDTGSSAANAALSEKRARAVADWLAKNGVPRHQIYFQGAGEGYPVASNTSEEGRAQNRRVEFIEVYGEAEFSHYLDSRRANYALYRPVDADSAPAAVPAVKARPARQRAVAKASGAPSGTGKSVKGSASASSRAVQGAGQLVLDFGGEPLRESTRMIDLGTVSATSQTGEGLISVAHASGSEAFIARCDQDRPRVIGSVRSLDSGKVYRTHEHLKGLYGASWAQMLNGHLVVMHKVAVLRDGTAPNNPDVRLYANYSSRQRKSARPAWEGKPQVNVYQGSNGLLYRMFLNNGAGVQCMDVLFPRGGDAQAQDGKLIYGPDGHRYAVDFKPVKQP